MSKNFWNDIPADCKKAISELRRLKVFGLCAFDYEEVFTDVWWLVLHEVDMYCEGEFCKEKCHSYWGVSDPQAMSWKQAQTADKWLVKYWDLAYKYSKPEMLSDYHKQIFSGWGDGLALYTGQLI